MPGVWTPAVSEHSPWLSPHGFPVRLCGSRLLLWDPRAHVGACTAVAALRIKSPPAARGQPRPLCPGLRPPLGRADLPPPRGFCARCSLCRLCSSTRLSLPTSAPMSPPASASSGCSHRIPQTGWLMNNINLFLIVRRLEVQGQGGASWARVVPARRARVRVAGCPLLAVFSPGGGAGELWGSLSEGH